MKKLFCGLLFFTALISRAQTADEIIEKHLVALGGKEKLKNIASVRMSIKGQGMGMEFPVEMLTKKDGSMKTTTTIQKMKMVQAYDGNSKSGWSINPMMGDKKPQKMNEEQVKDMQEQGGRMVSEFLDYKESGAVAEYLGKDDMDGEEVHLIRLTKKNGNITYYYIDVLSNLILKEKTKTKMKDKEAESETYFGNYQTFDGITSAGTIENMFNGVTGFVINVEKVEYNIPVDEKEFKMPSDENTSKDK